MKFLCPACERLTAFSSFRVEGDALVLRCSRCGVESRSQAMASEGLGPVSAAIRKGLSGALAPAFGLKVVPAPSDETEPGSALAPDDAGSVPAGHCPKCIALRPAGAASCAHCGLVFANFQPEGFEPSPGVADLWSRALSHWEDIEAHDRLLQAALIQGELATVGRLYRIRLARAPEDVYAARGRDEVLRLATAGSTGFAKAEAEDPSPASQSWKYILLVLIIVACVIAFFGLYRQIRNVSS